MKKLKFSKVVLVLISIIGIFGISYAGAQYGMMRALQEETPQQLEPISQSSPAEAVVPDDFEMPNIEVVDNTEGIVDEAWLTIEEAAELGAFYIWELFGESVEGTRFDIFQETFYVDQPWWEIYVKNNKDETLYWFSLDAVNGERLSMMNESYYLTLQNLHSDVGVPGPITESDYLPDEQMDEYYELAREFASIIFENELSDIELISDQEFLWNLEDVIVDQHFTFQAMDTAGQEATLVISREFKTLIEYTRQDFQDNLN